MMLLIAELLLLLMAMMDGVNALSHTHGISESGAAFNFHFFFMNCRLESSCELVQLLCCTHVRNLQDKRLELVKVFLHASRLDQTANGIPGNLD